MTDNTPYQQYPMSPAHSSQVKQGESSNQYNQGNLQTTAEPTQLLTPLKVPLYCETTACKDNLSPIKNPIPVELDDINMRIAKKVTFADEFTPTVTRYGRTIKQPDRFSA